MHDEDLRQRMASVQKKVNATTWQGISMIIARVVLLAFGSLWFRTFLGWIQPNLTLTAGVPGLLDGALDLFLAGALAAACTTVPSIFLAGIIPNSPANTLLAGLDQKYGRPGYIFAVSGAFVFTILGLFVLHDYWITRPAFADVAQAAGTVPTLHFLLPYILTLVSIMLMVGFPAWALNRMTPEQWVDAITQARHVARIKNILDLQDMSQKAIIARMHTLLYMDLSKLTLEQRAANNREAAAILAASERAIAASMRQVSGTFKSLYGMELVTQSENDADINRRYKGLADHWNIVATEAEEHADYGEQIVDLVPEPPTVDRAHRPWSTAPAAPLALRPRSTIRRPDAAALDHGRSDHTVERGPQRTAADHGVVDHGRPQPPSPALTAAQRDGLARAVQELGHGLFLRSDIERVLNVEKSKAVAIIKGWLERGLIRSIDNPKHHYTFVEAAVAAHLEGGD